MTTETVQLKTEDQIDIVGLFRNDEHERAAILVHMMPATKESWDAFAIELDHAGYASLAIDERGHGESTMDGTLDYKKFTDAEQQAKILDLEAAFAFLLDQGFEKDQIIVVGASIGANLAIEFLARHKEVRVAIALSPGLDYHGVLAEPPIESLSFDQKVILVASNDDEYSFDSVERLEEDHARQTTLVRKFNLGHGTHMFENDPGLMKELITMLPR